MKKIKDILICAVFFAFIAVSFLLLLLLPKKEYSVNEKRYLAKFPEITLQSVLDTSFGKGLENYINDHIFARDFYVSLNSYFNLAMGRNTASDIYYCKNGYLINAPGDDDTSKFDKSIGIFENFSKTAGIPSYLLMVPRTGYIMDGVLPFGHEKYNDDELFEKAAKATDFIKMADLRSELKEEAENGGAVCYRTDHHLTSYGNYVMYKKLMEMMGREAADEDEFKKESAGGFCGTTWSGSGYSLVKGDEIEMWQKDGKIKISIQDPGKDEIVSDSLFFREHLNELDKYPVFIDGNHSFVEIENKSVKDGTLLVLKDSYAQCFATFLAQSYRNVYLIDMRYYRAPVSDFVKEHDIDAILYMYGVSTLLTDTNSAWIL